MMGLLMVPCGPNGTECPSIPRLRYRGCRQFEIRTSVDNRLFRVFPKLSRAIFRILDAFLDRALEHGPNVQSIVQGHAEYIVKKVLSGQKALASVVGTVVDEELDRTRPTKAAKHLNVNKHFFIRKKPNGDWLWPRSPQERQEDAEEVQSRKEGIVPFEISTDGTSWWKKYLKSAKKFFRLFMIEIDVIGVVFESLIQIWDAYAPAKCGQLYHEYVASEVKKVPENLLTTFMNEIKDTWLGQSCALFHCPETHQAKSNAINIIGNTTNRCCDSLSLLEQGALTTAKDQNATTTNSLSAPTPAPLPVSESIAASSKTNSVSAKAVQAEMTKLFRESQRKMQDLAEVQSGMEALMMDAAALDVED